MESIEDLDKELEQVEKRGYRVRYLDPLSHGDNTDPTEYLYLPVLERDGVTQDKVPGLVEKMNKVALVRKWVDITVVGPDLEPVDSANSINGGNSALAHNTIRGRIGLEDYSHLSPDELIATQLTHGVRKTVGKADERSPYERLPEHLKKLLAGADLEDVENVDEAIEQVLGARED